jgi:predicted nucleic acid-binding protein
MKILLDTNIIVDIISGRDEYESSLELMRSCEDKRFDGYMTTTTITDIMYILRKHSSQNILRNTMQGLMKILEIAEVSKKDIHLSFLSDMADFEDGVQAYCGLRYGVEYVITKNLSDFEFSPVKAISPKDFLLLHN